MTTRIGMGLLLIGALAVGGCGQADPTSDRSDQPEVTGESAVSESYLPTPFTAEEIRAEWIGGFELVMRRDSPAGESLERWRVVDADDLGVEIEFSPIGAHGEPLGEPRVQRTTWEELRDHARFPVDRASRTWIVQTTPLGDLEGWLYSVNEPEGDTVAVYFFAQSLPGAPVHLRVVSGDETVLELAQLERFRPPAPEQG